MMGKEWKHMEKTSENESSKLRPGEGFCSAAVEKLVKAFAEVEVAHDRNAQWVTKSHK